MTILLKIWEVKIFKFGNVSGPMAAKWPKVNRGLKIVNYFTCMRHFSCRWYRPPEVDLNGYPRISNPYCWDIQIRKCEWSHGYKMNQIKSLIKKLAILHVCGTSFVGSRDPQKLIWIDTQGSLTHIVAIFKFGNVSGPRATKWPKVNCRLKIVNYFTCMQHFSCRW